MFFSIALLLFSIVQVSAPSSCRVSESASEFRADSSGHCGPLKAFGNAQISFESIAVLQA